LSDLLQLHAARVNKDRLYRALDRLLPRKAALEAHLVKRVGELFAVDSPWRANTSPEERNTTLVSCAEPYPGQGGLGQL
jgi:hypothetical protein